MWVGWLKGWGTVKPYTPQHAKLRTQLFQVSGSKGLNFVSEIEIKASAQRLPSTTVDDIHLHYLKDPKLWELWYIPYHGKCRAYIISRSMFSLTALPIRVRR